ncbi:hydantoinase/oxoprolinase N-terminal domain-containing protein [Pseudogemmobacter sp. W21_MBD1_M6]|uniref:hydantoinase/oxoprolinase N-terminal domain-containing protein n=1 Tax=Pseudogemmobacter sp. W21_MBD1_M6 TaxID=3240271 RepID=UPI003F96760F
MTILLGVDTGGTYTDAVLLQDETTVLAKAKALTTRHDLAEGVGAAIDAVLVASGVSVGDISMASLSTTLATNALVEGQGGRVALVFIGFTATELTKQDLAEALKSDPALILAGGHDHNGTAITPLDETGLRDWLALHGAQVSAFAVASQFATRNPAHELRAQEIIVEMTGRPVSCSHHLSARLNGPKRAMTAVLNARLIGMIDHLISSSEALLRHRGIDAPLMVVRGDGALISSATARERPIETILSGPAASIMGALWLTQEQDAFVSDIGGTTTDVAILRGGRPMIDPQGARVGRYRTMVEAVAMRTTGLGGDSELHLVNDGLEGRLFLGPRRVMPVSLCAQTWPDLVLGTLERQVASLMPGEYDGRFVVPIRRSDVSKAGLSDRELAILDRIGQVPCAMEGLFRSRMESAVIPRLVERGLVLISAVTPSDAAHVLGKLDAWNRQAADLALTLFARRKTGDGRPLCATSHEMAVRVVDQLTDQTALCLLESAFAEDPAFTGDPADLARHTLTRTGLARHRGLIAADIGLNLPVIGLGASAPCYYGAVGDRLNTRMVLPEHAGVANAIGAVVGQVVMRESGTMTVPGAGQFRIHLADGPKDFVDQAQALEALETVLRDRAVMDARASGADQVNITVTRDFKTATVEGAPIVLEAMVTVSVSGRPRVAIG